MLLRSGQGKFPGALGDFLAGEIASVGGDHPCVTEWVLYIAGAVSPEHLLHRMGNDGSCSDRLLKRCIDIPDVEIKRDRRIAERFRALGRTVRRLFAEHEG